MGGGGPDRNVCFFFHGCLHSCPLQALLDFPYGTVSIFVGGLRPLDYATVILYLLPVFVDTRYPNNHQSSL